MTSSSNIRTAGAGWTSAAIRRRTATLLSDGEIYLAITNGDLFIDPLLQPGDLRLQAASIDRTLDTET